MSVLIVAHETSDAPVGDGFGAGVGVGVGAGVEPPPPVQAARK